MNRSADCDPPPHTLDDCLAAVEDQWAATHGGQRPALVDPPAGLIAAQEIRLRLAEAILAADGIPLVDSLSAFMERVGRVIVGVAAVVETGEEQLADWEREAVWMDNTDAKYGPFRPAPDAGDTTEATG